VSAAVVQCTVYKSLRQFDYFLYVRSDEQFERVPAGLKQLLGNLEKVIEVELHAERKLAQADVAEVMRQIEAQGYYLQMPPRSGSEPLVS
jgi:uncharacterized protein YcgL (UPF0745 family)